MPGENPGGSLCADHSRFFFPIRPGPRYANDQDFPDRQMRLSCHVQECITYSFGIILNRESSISIVRYHLIILCAKSIIKEIKKFKIFIINRDNIELVVGIVILARKNK